MTEQTNSDRWEMLQQVISRRFVGQKAARYIDEIVYQVEDYFEQTREISANKKLNTPLFLVQCVDANQKLDGWRVEYTTIETRPQDSSRFFKQELDARIFFEMLEQGKYVSALEFAHRCLLQAMGVNEAQEQTEPNEEEQATAAEMEAAAYEAELLEDTILAQQELEDFESAGAGPSTYDFDPFEDGEDW